MERYLEAQRLDYEVALSEIQLGRKSSHWMWYIFPQYKGLGKSETSRYYAIQSLDEAREFLNHPILGFRLRQISTELLKHEGLSAYQIFGQPDDLKLNSCMTLFSLVDDSKEKIFKKVLEKYFDGKTDLRTERSVL